MRVVTQNSIAILTLPCQSQYEQIHGIGNEGLTAGACVHNQRVIAVSHRHQFRPGDRGDTRFHCEHGQSDGVPWRAREGPDIPGNILVVER